MEVLFDAGPTTREEQSWGIGDCCKSNLGRSDRGGGTALRSAFLVGRYLRTFVFILRMILRVSNSIGSHVELFGGRDIVP